MERILSLRPSLGHVSEPTSQMTSEIAHNRSFIESSALTRVCELVRGCSLQPSSFSLLLFVIHQLNFINLFLMTIKGILPSAFFFYSTIVVMHWTSVSGQLKFKLLVRILSVVEHGLNFNGSVQFWPIFWISKISRWAERYAMSLYLKVTMQFS